MVNTSNLQPPAAFVPQSGIAPSLDTTDSEFPRYSSQLHVTVRNSCRLSDMLAGVIRDYAFDSRDTFHDRIRGAKNSHELLEIADHYKGANIKNLDLTNFDFIS